MLHCGPWTVSSAKKTNLESMTWSCLPVLITSTHPCENIKPPRPISFHSDPPRRKTQLHTVGKMSPLGVPSELWICWQDSPCTAGASRWAPCLSEHGCDSANSAESKAAQLHLPLIWVTVCRKNENYKEMQGVHSPWSKDMIMQHSRSWILHSILALASETVRKLFSRSCLSS